MPGLLCHIQHGSMALSDGQSTASGQFRRCQLLLTHKVIAFVVLGVNIYLLNVGH